MHTPSLLHNIASLGVLQVVNFLLNLVMIPYLTRVLGVETWGRVVFVQLVVNYFVWFCNWGFYLGGTRKIAENRNNISVLADVFMATFFAQWVLTIASIVILSLLLLYVPFFSKDRLLYVYGIGLLVSNALMPFWFLNGLERIKEVAVIQVLAKVLSIPIILLFVRESGDAHLYIAALAGGAILMGVVTVIRIKKTYLFSYSLPGWKRMYVELKGCADLFFSTTWATLYGALTPTALGLLAGPTVLGYYNLADRARGAATTITQPITHALFPRMLYLFNSKPNEAIVLLKRSGAILFILSGTVSLILWLFAENVLFILGGKDFIAATGSLRWLAVTPLLSTISSFFIHQIIIPAQKSRFYNVAIFATLLLTAMIAVPAIYWMQAEGAAIVVFVAELFFASITLIYLVKNNFFLKRAAR